MFGLKWNYITIVTVVLGLGFLGYLDFKLYYAYVAPVNYEIKQASVIESCTTYNLHDFADTYEALEAYWQKWNI